MNSIEQAILQGIKKSYETGYVGSITCYCNEQYIDYFKEKCNIAKVSGVHYIENVLGLELLIFTKVIPKDNIYLVPAQSEHITFEPGIIVSEYDAEESSIDNSKILFKVSGVRLISHNQIQFPPVNVQEEEPSVVDCFQNGNS